MPAAFVTSVYFTLAIELLPPRRRAQLAGVAYASKHAVAAASCLAFPWLMETVGRRALYAFYAAVAAMAGSYLAWRLPETKGKRLAEVWRDLR